MKCKNDSSLESKPQSFELNTIEEYNTLLNSTKISISKYLLNERLSILWGNDFFYSNLGYTKNEYQSLFSNLQEYYSLYPKEFETIRNELFSMWKNGSFSKKLNCRMPAKNGNFLWVNLSITITNEVIDGFPVFNAVIFDISDMIHHEEEQKYLIEEKLQNLKWMMDEYEGNIYISDIETYELLYLNKVSCATLKKPLTQLLGKKCYEVIQGRTSPCTFCTNKYLTKDKFYEWEFFNPVLDRNFLIKNRIIDWNGRKARIELSHDMYSAEYKLAKKDKERDALIRTIPGGFARLDARDMKTILWYGAQFLELIGYTKEQFEKELHSQCTYIYPEDLTRAVEMIQNEKNSNKNTVLDARIRTYNGEERILTITLSYVSGEDSWDGIPSFYSIGIDVTEERREQIRQREIIEDAYKALQVANSAKTNFFSSMSHDIRTPINAIVGMTSIAQANLTLPKKIEDCLNKISTSSHHLLNLVSEVLDMSKIESGKIDLVPVNVDLSELVQNVVDMCKPLMKEKYHDFKIIPRQIQHEKVVADRERLQQIFMNILSNAIKYTPDGGGISLTINELPSLIPQKGWYEFIFKDNGIGMSSEFIEKIFEPFSRAEDSRTSKIQGTGLGMAITENVIHMMNGTINVKSELGAGSQFTVTLPLQLQDEEENVNNELIGLPILVVDDDQIVCESVSLLLNELKLRSYWVLSGAEAVHVAADAHNRADDFFAVIIDWKMPEMDGLETVKAIREKLGEDVPIIIISAYDYSDIEEEFLEAGVDAFITKPIFKSKILHVLQLFCSSGRIKAASNILDKKYNNLCGKRILVVEDNELNREIVIELLQMQGILVDSAENGKKAVEKFQNSDPDYYSAILMDIQMPVMNGYEATAAIRALSHENAKTIPILALTANAFVSDISKAQSAGMNDHIAKPIDISRLIKVLHKWIE